MFAASSAKLSFICFAISRRTRPKEAPSHRTVQHLRLLKDPEPRLRRLLVQSRDLYRGLNQRLSVSQGTEIVATVLISDVRTNFSIAQVQPDTLRGDLHKGDSALLIH